MDSDTGLFSRYQAAPGGETFRPLALRHLPLIWSTARRLVNGDHALAEDVAQVVLADFVRKAPRLPPGTVAAGWLHRHTCFTARRMVRTEVRRRARERQACALHGPDNAGAPGASLSMSSESHPVWQEAAPLLDAVLNQLARRDREAVLLRFYQRQDHRSIGAAMGCSEEAARKRIARALEKLRAEAPHPAAVRHPQSLLTVTRAPPSRHLSKPISLVITTALAATAAVRCPTEKNRRSRLHHTGQRQGILPLGEALIF